MAKNPSAKQETWVQPLGQEDLLEKAIVTTLAFLPGKSHGQRSLVCYSPWGHKNVSRDLVTNQPTNAWKFYPLKKHYLVVMSFSHKYSTMFTFFPYFFHFFTLSF